MSVCISYQILLPRVRDVLSDQTAPFHAITPSHAHRPNAKVIAQSGPKPRRCQKIVIHYSNICRLAQEGHHHCSPPHSDDSSDHSDAVVLKTLHWERSETTGTQHTLRTAGTHKATATQPSLNRTHHLPHKNPLTFDIPGYS